MKNRINKNTLVNTKSYYNEQQIVRVLDSYVISKGLRYLIDGNELVTSLFQSKSNLMSISKEAGILVRADGEIYLNKSSSSISICGLVDHMSLAVSLGGYSAITHDLKIALEQVLENKEKITKHTVIFPYQITAIHWVLGEIQLNFDKNTHNLITANLNIYNSLKSEKNTIQGHVKKEISDLIKNLFACPELELIIDLIFTGQQDDVFSCGAIGAENGKGIIDGDIQSKLKINYHSDNATLLRIRHIREVNCERFDDMQLADEQWQNPEFQADQSYLKKIISALEKSKLDIAEILQKHDAISFGKFIKSSKGKIGDNEDILFSLLFKNEAGEWHDDALNTLWLACQHLAKRNEVNTEKDDSIGRVGDNRLKVTSITSDHNIDGNKIKKVEVSLQNVKKQDFMGSEILYKKGSVDAVFLKQENLVEETKPKSQHKEIEKEKQEINQGEQAFNAKLKYSDTALKGLQSKETVRYMSSKELQSIYTDLNISYQIVPDTMSKIVRNIDEYAGTILENESFKALTQKEQEQYKSLLFKKNYYENTVLGNTVLHWAAKYNQDILQLLVDKFKGNMLEVKNRDCLTAPHFAAQYNPASLKILIDEFKEKVLEARDKYGCTVLHFAAKYNPASLKILANAFKTKLQEVRDRYGSTPLPWVLSH